MRILYITTIGITMGFFKPFIKRLIAEGNEVDIATNETESPVPACYRDWNCAVYQIDTSRSPFNKGNIHAVRQIKRLVEKEKYDIVHCHTPVAAMCTRLACKDLRKKGTKVIYTAHGFHFYKGAPLKNWLVYYPVERFLTRYTDCQITINHEDYVLAQRLYRKNGGRVEYVPGVGFAADKFVCSADVRAAMRAELGITDDETLLLSVGEINQNKNHKTVIEALAGMGRKDIRYVICGVGPSLDSHKQLVHELGLDDQVMFVGYRTDVEKFYQAADFFVIPSFREGLPVAPMEAMAAGLPCLASRIRGNVDLFAESQLMFDPHDAGSLCKALTKAADKNIVRQEIDRNKKTLQRFSTQEVINAMKRIYADVIQQTI